MYRNRLTALGDVVIGRSPGVSVMSEQEGDVVVPGDFWSERRFDFMPGMLGDIVVPHEGGIVVNAEMRPGIVVAGGPAEGWDMQQDQFTGDDVMVRDLSWPVGHTAMTQLVRTVPVGPVTYGGIPYASPSEIGGGDDGVGAAQARRLRRRIKGKRVRLGGRQVVRYQYAVGDTLYDPYGFGLRIRLPKFIRKFQFGRFLRRTALPFAAGGAAGLLFARKGLPAIGKLFRRGGGEPQPAPEPGAPPEIVQGPTVIPMEPRPSVPSAPVATDSAGGGLPPDILAALRQALSPAGRATAPTASEQVAAAAEEAGGGPETAATTGPAGGPQEAGLFGAAPDLSGMVPILALGAGLFLLSRALPGRPTRRRRRR